MFSHREQRQLEQPAVFLLRHEAAHRIGASDDHRAVMTVVIITERNRFKPQHRRLQHLVTSGAQARGCGLIVRMRAGDENRHAPISKRPAVRQQRTIALRNRAMLTGTSLSNRRFGRPSAVLKLCKGSNWIKRRQCWCWVSRRPAMKPRPPWSSARALGL